jgi:hypothetical protein
MSTDPRRFWAGALFAAAAAWPSIAGLFTALTASPYERALQAAWCGVAPHDAFVMLGHCPACWAGATLLALAGGAQSLWKPLPHMLIARAR